LRGERSLKHAYFPQGIVLSLLTMLENGSAIETANIGREGAFGLFAATIKVDRNGAHCGNQVREGSWKAFGLPRILI
jgi:hypothetical protein